MNATVILCRPMNPRSLTPGVRLRVDLDHLVTEATGIRRPGPHRVGRAEVLNDGRLAVSLVDTAAGRTARALLAEGCIDAELWGTRPVVRLRTYPNVAA